MPEPTQMERLMDRAAEAADGLLAQIQATAKHQPPRADVEGISDADFLRLTRSHLYQQFDDVLRTEQPAPGGADPADLAAALARVAELEREVATAEHNQQRALDALREVQEQANAIMEQAKKTDGQLARAMELIEQQSKAIAALEETAERNAALHLQAEKELTKAAATLRTCQDLARKFAGLAGECAQILQLGPPPAEAKKEGVRLAGDLETLKASAEEGGIL